jgi:hypothetical protein
MADEEEAGAEGGEGGDDAYDPQRALVAQSLEVNKLRQHVEVLKRANERIRDQYKQEIRSLLQPLIERHRKLQLENGKLQEKIEKLSVAPPGSDEALVEELRKLRHDHGILQKITEGLEADSRLARRLQAELEEGHQRIEALDVRVADLERERRRLEMLVAERDQARVTLDEELEKAQTDLRDWKEKHDKAQQSHKDELRGYQQQLGEAIGRYKALEKQHQDALFARDLLPILYEELQAEAATYDELTALFAGERGDADAYQPMNGEGPDVAPVAEMPFSGYQPSPGATIALATGVMALGGMAADAQELADFGVGDDGPQPAHELYEEAIATEADMVGALVDPLDDLPLDDLPLDDAPAYEAHALDVAADDRLQLDEPLVDHADALLVEAPVDLGLADLAVMADDLGEAELVLLTPVPPATVGGELEIMDLGDLGLSDDEMAVLHDLTGDSQAQEALADLGAADEPAFDVGGFSFEATLGADAAADATEQVKDVFATEAMHAGYELAAEAERLAAADDLLILDDDGFTSDGEALEPAEATAAPVDLPFSAASFSFGEPDTVLAMEDDTEASFDALPDVETLLVDDEPLVLDGMGFDEELAEMAAAPHGEIAHPITDEPHLALDPVATIEEMGERSLIDRDSWEIDDGTEPLTVDETAPAPGDETTIDFASQLAQSLGSFAETTDEDVEELIWEDGPVDEEPTADMPGVMFAPGALETPAAPPAAPVWDGQADDELDEEEVALPPEAMPEAADDESVSLNLGLGWPAAEGDAVPLAVEAPAVQTDWDAPALSAQPEEAAGSWAAAMATDAVGLRHSETGISPEEIARLLDDDDDLGVAMSPADTGDSPDFRIQPPKLEPPPLP